MRHAQARQQVIATLLRRGRADLVNRYVVQIIAEEQEAPDAYRERTGRCPRGYRYDGEKCIPTEPKGEKPADKALDGPEKPAKAPPKGKRSAKPKKPKEPPVRVVGPDEDYNLSEDLKGVTTLAELAERHGGVKKALGHMGLSKMPPPKIDPASVTINLSGDPDSHSVMSWRDDKGRLQSSYTQRFLKRNAAVKWERVKRLTDKAEAATNKFKDQMATAASEKQRDAAAVMAIISTTGLRPGSTAHLRATGSRGISTLGPDNVKIDGDVVTLDFIGKSGKRNVAKFTDPAIARYVERRVEAGADPIFKADSKDMASQMKAAGIDKFKPKDFRTLRAGKLAATTLSDLEQPPPPLPDNDKQARKLLEQRIKQASAVVAKQLNNTPAIARSSYINPAIIRAWLSRVGGERLVQAAAPSADDIWNAAMKIRLPGHDQPVKADDDEDEQLDAAPLPL